MLCCAGLARKFLKKLCRLNPSLLLLCLVVKPVWPMTNDERPTTLCERPTAFARTNDNLKETSITRADIQAFLVIGIGVRTSNAKEGTADGIIPRQWQRFLQEGILGAIPSKTGSNIYAVYSDYASDHNGEYTFVIGAMVKEGTVPPPGMVAKR